MVRAVPWIAILLLAALALPAAEAAYFGCQIRTSCLANETLLIRLNSSEPSTPNNSHAQLANHSGGYPYSVCCSTDAFRTLSNSCAAGNPTTVLKLFAETNSHVQAGTQSGYTWNACLNVTSGNITCEYPNSACSAGYSQVVSMASSESGDSNLTNAHVGDFALYLRKVCCKVGGQSPPAVDSASISPNPTATTRDDLTCLNGTVSDADGDTVTLHYNWYRNGTSITVLNLPMDYDGSTTHDISGYGNHGTVNGATFLPTDGYVGGAFDFNGNYIDVGNWSDYSIRDSVTMAAWIKRRHDSSGQSKYIFSNDRDCCGAYGGMSLRMASGTNRTMMILWNGTASQSASGSTVLAADTWYHIVATFNGTHIAFYTNGNSDGATAVAAGFFIGTPTYRSYVGTLAYGNPYSAYRFNGTIDEFIVFNRSLSAQEVATLYRSYGQQLNSTELRRADLWNCSITPVDSTGLNGSTKRSGETAISGSPPLNVSLLYPANNNQSVFERYVNFSWSAADERDGDAITYSLNLTVTPGTCSVQAQLTGLTTTNRTYGELCTDQLYNWTVRACDTDGCSAWAGKYNFTIASVLSIRLLNNNTDFGALVVEQNIDTEYGGVAPFSVENDGNVMANVTVNATNSPFTQASLGSTAFQFKAREYESGAYNASGSQLTYTAMDSIIKNVLKQLNYSDTRDAAYVDINITVPVGEPPGDKTTDVTFRATVSS